MNWFGKMLNDLMRRQQTLSWDDFYHELEKKLGRSPTPQEIQKEMNDALFSVKGRSQWKPYNVANRNINKEAWLVDINPNYDVDSKSIYTRNQKEHHRQKILYYRRKIRESREQMEKYRKKDDHRKVEYYEEKIDHYTDRLSYHEKKVLYYQRKEDQSHLKEKQEIRRRLNF